VAQEAARTTPVKGQPGLPTPDNVMLLENMPAFSNGAGMKRAMPRRHQQLYQNKGGNKRMNQGMNGNGNAMKAYGNGMNGMNGQINGMKMLSI
jgi:hypothetical protein